MLSVFFLSGRFGVFVFFFAVLLFLGSLFGISLQERFLGCRCWFCLGLCFIFWHFTPETVRNILLMSGLPFFGFVLPFLGFPLSSFLFLRDTAQVVTGHAPDSPFWSVFFFLVLSKPRLAYHPFWPCVPSFSRFVGCHAGPWGSLRFVGFSRYLGGWRLLAPF